MRQINFISVLFAIVFSSVCGTAGLFQKIHAKNGMLYYEDGQEVCLWGVNFQPGLSFEYAARMEDQNLLVPLKADDLKQVADQSFDELQILNCSLIRIHICPADFTDRQGNLQETIWLDVLDYTMAQAEHRGIYIYLTFLNDMPHGGFQFRPNEDSFASVFPRAQWMIHDEAITATGNYIRQLLNRTNPYTGELYKNSPALAFVEPINEPDYSPADPERYDSVKSYVNRMVALFRSEGITLPVVWNCGWPKLIRGRDDVFQAIADSDADAVSFCMYPGQEDLKHPYWAHMENLKDKNFLPYIQRCFDDPEYLRWVLAERFAGKAKVVYEYETICNQSSYLYPAMAKVFRSLGAQVAAHWTYALTGYAEYSGGSHVLNLKTTPGKAASFMLAGRVFETVPLYSEYSTTTSETDVFNNTALSFSQDLSAGINNGMLIHSRTLPEHFLPEVSSPQKITGVGSSPFVKYDGSGLYFIKPAENDALRVTIFPDSKFILPHWKEERTGELVVQLDPETNHRFELSLPEYAPPRFVYRKQNFRWVPVESTVNGNAIQFSARAGEYLIEKAPVIIPEK